MKNSRDGFLIGRLKSFRHAFKGAYLLLKTEHSIITQFLLAALFIVIGILVNITKTEWMFQLLAFGLIVAVESINTAVEKLCDFIHSDYHKQIGFIKDISAGAVIFAALFALTILLIIYLPYLYERVH